MAPVRALFILFNVVGFVALFLLQLAQGRLPLNPQHLGPVRWDLAINTAVSFVTNTNWQAYGGESTMTYLTQMLGMTVQNFLSAAIGVAVMLPLLRAFVRKLKATVGNFWVDTTRVVLYILLPLSIVLAVVLASQGVVQTYAASPKAHTLEGAEQVIAVGPVASQIAIKQLGSNGGGFFNTNSAHPFENPTWASNLLEIFAILLIPMATPFAFGAMIRNRRQGWAIFAAMMILFLIGLSVVLWAESSGNPLLSRAGVAGGINMEGKEARFGITSSALWGQATTVTSSGSVNAMHDSMMPLTGLVYMFNIAVGEVIFGGVGVGMIGILMYAILTLFLAGLMIGRTPEFLGKKARIEGDDHGSGRRGRPGHLISHIRGDSRHGPPRTLEPQQFRTPRPLGDSLRLLLRRRQQRVRLRGAQFEHALLQPHHGLRHAHRQIRHYPARPRGRRVPCRQKGDPAELCHLPDGERPLCGHARGGGGYRRRPHLLSRPRAGTRARPSPASDRSDVLGGFS